MDREERKDTVIFTLLPFWEGGGVWDNFSAFCIWFFKLFLRTRNHATPENCNYNLTLRIFFFLNFFLFRF